MLQREQGKDKALRIDLAYHRQRTWLDRARFAAIVSGLLLSTAYAVWILVLVETNLDIPRGSRTSQLSTGPLALVHASFENDCQQCHADVTGLGLAHDGWLSEREPRLQLLEEKCQNCHVVGHHAREKLAQPELDRDCSRCHIDHQGKTHSLVAIADSTCTACHADLRLACRAESSPQSTNTIADFSVQSHGIANPSGKSISGSTATQFRSLLKDSGRVRFDHAQHLQPGQVDAGSKGGFQLSMLTPALREVYRRPGEANDSLIQLDCSSCHQPLALQASTATQTRQTAPYYAPIQFENHCAACHQITFPGQATEDLPLPHVAQRQEFAKLIAAKQNFGAARGSISSPGEQIAATDPLADPVAIVKPVESLQSKIDEAVSAVFVRCRQCHFEEDTQPEPIARALAGTLPPLIPQRWLQRGFFNHSAHASIERCVYCHEMPKDRGPAQDHQNVLIRGPESCVPCHRSSDLKTPEEIDSVDERLTQLGAMRQPTWASAQCTTCHQYHATSHASSVSHLRQVIP